LIKKLISNKRQYLVTCEQLGHKQVPYLFTLRYNYETLFVFAPMAGGG
jgi:hypothetical protein